MSVFIIAFMDITFCFRIVPLGFIYQALNSVFCVRQYSKHFKNDNSCPAWVAQFGASSCTLKG